MKDSGSCSQMTRSCKLPIACDVRKSLTRTVARDCHATLHSWKKDLLLRVKRCVTEGGPQLDYIVHATGTVDTLTSLQPLMVNSLKDLISSINKFISRSLSLNPTKMYKPEG